MANRMTMMWQRNPGRVAGVFYFLVFSLSIVASLRLMISTEEVLTDVVFLMTRIGLVSDLIHLVFFLLLAWALYVIFSPANKNLALLVMLSITVSVAIQAINALNLFAALSLLSGIDYMTVFDPAEVQALAMFYLELHMDVNHIVEIFWFLWVFTAGYLVYTTGVLPKNLGILLIVGGLGYLLIVLQFYLFPNEVLFGIGAAAAGLAEISLMVWLLWKGSKMQEYQITAG
jgi:hypothetical protein